jgi:hypothetical protein
MSTDTTLSSNWCFYCSTTDTWDPSFLKKIKIETVEQFWSVYEKLPKESFHLGMFFLMRDTISPTWEDERNRYGGCLSYKIHISDIYSIWESLSIKMMITQLTNESQDIEETIINGISVSPKKGFCILKIWINDISKSNMELLLDDIPKLKNSDVMFTAFRDKK